MDIDKKFAEWPKSASGRFYVVSDVPTLGHHFCITHKHVAYAADRCRGMLGEEAMAKYPCGICKRPYEDHKEKVVLVYCEVEPKGDEENELREYLQSIASQVENEGYVGFAFVRGWDK